MRLRCLRGTLAGLLLGFLSGTAAFAQSGETVVAGTVTEADGAPIPGASVAAASGERVIARTLTDAAGRYRLAVPRPSGTESYELRIERVGYFTFVAQVTVPGAGGGSVTRDIRLNPSTVILPSLEVLSTRPAQRPPQGPTPGGNEEAWQPYFTDPYPLEPGDLGAIAAHRPGVVPLGGDDPDGLPRVSIAGRPPSQNRVLVDGASFGASTLPAEALRSTSIVSNSYDPARGQFSGGQIAATTRSGTNLFGGALRVRLEPAVLQAASGGAAESGRYSVAEAGGGAGGALLPGRLFWFAALQATRNASTPATLATLPTAILADLGLSADSVARFRGVTSALGFAPAWQRAAAQAVARTASGLARIDLNASRAHTLTLRLDARGSETRGLGASAYGIGSPAERVSRTSAGALAQMASYLGTSRNELRAYRSVERRSRGGVAEMPGGFVDVLSDLGSGRAGLARLSFGEGAYPFEAHSTLTELSDELLLHLRGDEQRLKLGFTVGRESGRQEGVPNGSGTFSFRSLADLEAGRPASFTRTLGGAARDATSAYGALFAAHLWHAAPRLWVIQGVRVERTGFPNTPAVTSAVRAAFDLPAARIGARTEVSPRVGFVYETAGRLWDLRGGVGRFVGTLPLGPLAEAFGETGTGESRLVCLGAAAPTPDWARYAADAATLPTRCVDGNEGARPPLPAVTLFAPGFSPPRSWRASLGGGGALARGRGGRVDLHVDATLVLGSGEPLAVDRNLAAAAAFALAAEGSRPVFAPLERIDAATGIIDPALSRRFPELGVVREAASRGRSTVAQLTAGTSLLTRRFDLLGIYYTLTRATDRVTGFGAPGSFSAPVSAGDPNLSLGGPSDVQRRHSLQIQGVHPIGRWAEVGVLGRIVSGAPFTPRVDADVNGDGVANDAAFVFAAGDAELGGQMEDLLRSAPEGVRRCLARQFGRVAARNACSGPWRATLDLQLNLPVERGSRASRFTASVAASNVLAGLDRLLHGERGLRGWGSDGYVDPTLLRVQGFDAERRAFVYAVNPSFGQATGGGLLQLPATLTLRGRVTLGSDPARQPILAMTAGIRARGRTAAELGREIAARIPNTPRQVLVAADTLHLFLGAEQRAALEVQAEALGRRLGPLADTLAAVLSVVERDRDDTRRNVARDRSRALVAELEAGMDQAVEAARAVLTAEQWARLPEDVRRPARQLVPPRTISAGGADTW